MNNNLLVGQSGGPTAVINGSLYGVVSEGLDNPAIGQVIGMVNGIEGFLNGRMMAMEPLRENGELEYIRTTPGSFLGSCRYKLPEDLSDPVYPKLFEMFSENKIGYFFYIGGNDSMDTVSKLSRYAASIGSDIKIIGVPKTIDNDLVETDHTPGFASAAKYVASTVREIAVDASVYDNKQSVTIVEIMGRHAGWLTAASVLARKFEGDNPVLIYLPEVAFDTDAFINKVKEKLQSCNNLVVCISEGINDGKGTFICELASDVGVDNFGHKMLTGSGKYLENLVKEKLGIKVRSVELNVSQRCSSSCLSATDLDEAVGSGRYAVKAALEGETGKMITFIRKSSAPYKVEFGTADVALICNMEKPVPLTWITEDGSDIGEEFIAYAAPLLMGKVDVPLENGLPRFAYRK
ncbi:6-phosphofructokinase [Bariatricus massiliensis]|uniref:Pyrophosphate--fructose 6-phosphate 1-phosphotransferase n=1 Tax=Bariatricus massiliensis TaxID=1745713 RepID=A0ABS8DHZ3_9FIRM|nr:6-phosphofructokinase [Bariatricus massiliensis]MCB7304669.1 6-phosphofructokinase [Bariatricus massiliensis]MCB7374820.1 6-phosphofructokinase [Bariatricus massiliensis]MCB7388053.1 6-phosphofructokinase [Bariatricus massiliensis]MCB7411985.1 6-phosphofructokinase [Bariatricus massiliensis]MCQ5254224.1 6-phosphofructokinase [Bariatricus massiliensis]